VKALVFSESAKSALKIVQKPAINKSEMLLKVKACAICGTDIKLDRGSSTKLTKHGIKNMTFPRITGHEFAGVIEETGSDVTGFKSGERVNVSPVIPCMDCRFCRAGHKEMCDNKIIIGFDIDGGFAEYVRIPEIAIRSGCVHRMADDTGFEEATFVEPLAVVLNSQEITGVKPQDSILIIGAGPVGLLQIQAARNTGVSKIMVADISEERLNFAGKFGAGLLIDNKTDNLVGRVTRETNGDGVDVVLICASAKALFSESLKLAAKLGRINYFAGLSKNDSNVEIDANLVHYNELSITGTSDSTPEQNRRAMEMINSKKIDAKSLITHRFSLEKYYDGLEIARQGKAIKVVINF